MDVLTFETCWAVNDEIIKRVTSSWFFFIQLFLVLTQWKMRISFPDTSLVRNAFSKLAHPTPILGEVPYAENCRASDIIDIYMSNCPTRCNTKQSIYYSASSLHTFRVSTTPIMSTQNCNSNVVKLTWPRWRAMLGVQNMTYLCQRIKTTFLSVGRLCRATDSSYRILFAVAIVIIFVTSEFWPVYHVVQGSICHDAQLWIHLAQRLE